MNSIVQKRQIGGAIHHAIEHYHAFGNLWNDSEQVITVNPWLSPTGPYVVFSSTGISYHTTYHYSTLNKLDGIVVNQPGIYDASYSVMMYSPLSDPSADIFTGTIASFQMTQNGVSMPGSVSIGAPTYPLIVGSTRFQGSKGDLIQLANNTYSTLFLEPPGLPPGNYNGAAFVQGGSNVSSLTYSITKTSENSVLFVGVELYNSTGGITTSTITSLVDTVSGNTFSRDIMTISSDGTLATAIYHGDTSDINNSVTLVLTLGSSLSGVIMNLIEVDYAQSPGPVSAVGTNVGTLTNTIQCPTNLPAPASQQYVLFAAAQLGSPSWLSNTNTVLYRPVIYSGMSGALGFLLVPSSNISFATSNATTQWVISSVCIQGDPTNFVNNPSVASLSVNLIKPFIEDNCCC